MIRPSFDATRSKAPVGFFIYSRSHRALSPVYCEKEIVQQNLHTLSVTYTRSTLSSNILPSGAGSSSIMKGHTCLKAFAAFGLFNFAIGKKDATGPFITEVHTVRLSVRQQTGVPGYVFLLLHKYRPEVLLTAPPPQCPCRSDCSNSAGTNWHQPTYSR
jgi:hypothetical protein